MVEVDPESEKPKKRRKEIMGDHVIEAKELGQWSTLSHECL